jgi:Sir2- and TIR-associating SLOG family/SIR2-like domain
MSDSRAVATARMPGFPRTQFIRDYTRAIDEGRAGLFLGAGASIPAGFVNWGDLLSDIAAELELEIDRVSDLLTLAQYHVNHRSGRQKINQAIIDEFDKMARPAALHDAIVRLPIDEVWTTNYDHVIEDAYANAGRNPDVKSTAASVNVHKTGRDVSIYKMHGDSRDPAHAVLTRDDYERYSGSDRGSAFLAALGAALSNRTFLFIGFSFNDPNIGHVLSRMRLLFGENRPEHFAIFKRPDWYEDFSDPEDRAKAKFVWRSTELQIQDLKRFGIHVVLVEDYADIAPLLESLVKSSRRNHVFVSGAAFDASPFGEQRLQDFSRALGSRLAVEGKHLISGLGAGVGQDVVQGFFQAGFDGKAVAVGERATLRPFPQRAPGGTAGLQQFWTAYRSDMLRLAGFVIYVAGNRRNRETGEVEPSLGVIEEFEIATRYGAVPIPVGATGHVARELWERVMADVPAFYPKEASVKRDLEVLGDSSSRNDELLDTVMRIINIVAEVYS